MSKIRGAYRQAVKNNERLEINDVWCNLRHFDGLALLIITPILYDRSSYVTGLWYVCTLLRWSSCPPARTTDDCISLSWPGAAASKIVNYCQ